MRNDTLVVVAEQLLNFIFDTFKHTYSCDLRSKFNNCINKLYKANPSCINLQIYASIMSYDDTKVI